MHKVLEDLNICPDCGEAESLICSSCGGEFTRTSKQRPRFCSNACKQKAYRDRQKLACLPLAEFRQQKRWVRASGKRPVMVDGSAASSTNPVTWASFAEVQSGAGDGFGVVLDGSGLGCYDFDNCFDGDVLKPAVREFVAGIAYPIVYVERSVSGNGLHVFVEAEKQRGFRRDGVEFYSWGRFIRTTFNTFIL